MARGKRAADEQQDAALVIARDRVWEMHLRGVPKARIARELGIDRETVTRHIKACYAESGRDLKAERTRKLDAAIIRLRRIQEQAWDYCDADDERERSVLALMLSGEAEPSEGNGEKSGSKNNNKGRSMVRYQSQRSQYLRVVLEAEKEIARLEGLYEALGEDVGTVTFRFVREGHPTEQGGAVVATARLAAVDESVKDE